MNCSWKKILTRMSNTLAAIAMLGQLEEAA